MIIYVYNGAGSSSFSANNMKFALQMALQNHGYSVQHIDHNAIRSGEFLEKDNVKMLVLAGGRFTEVKAAIGEEGLDHIRSYTYGGGTYLGVCMGSYAAFSDIDFEGKDKRTGKGLGFYNTVARGSLPIAPKYDGTGNSATIVEAHHMQRALKFPALYWGGNGMEEKELLDLGAAPLTKIYIPSKEGLKEKVMAASLNVGNNGGNAFLYGYHPEGYSRSIIWQWLTGLSPNSDCYRRLENEIIQHPEMAFRMGIASTLDDIGLVQGHSFTQQVHYGWIENRFDQLDIFCQGGYPPSRLIA